MNPLEFSSPLAANGKSSSSELLRIQPGPKNENNVKHSDIVQYFRTSASSIVKRD